MSRRLKAEAVLTLAQIASIQVSTMLYRDIAAIYGISPSYVREIRTKPARRVIALPPTRGKSVKNADTTLQLSDGRKIQSVEKP
jgi:hypothetical protein